MWRGGYIVVKDPKSCSGLIRIRDEQLYLSVHNHGSLEFVILFSVQHVSRIDIPMLDYYLHSITVRVSVSPFIILIYCSLTFSSLQRTNKFLATENSTGNNDLH